MAAIPNSEMPGHMSLHKRVVGALDRCQESQDIDFKESQNWETLRHQIIRSAMAMSNLRDGGIIVIGVSERNKTHELSGISDDHLSTYDPDVVVDAINKHSSPPVRIDVVTVTYNGKNFLAIFSHEFDVTPTVCSRNSTEDGKYYSRGQFLVRPVGKPQTKPVTEESEMHNLLDLAAEKRARKFIETARRVGLRLSESSKSQFDEELGGI